MESTSRPATTSTPCTSSTTSTSSTPSCSGSSVSLMSVNATKAGMDRVDAARVNAIILEASKDSRFFAAKSKRQEKIDAQKALMQEKARNLSKNDIKQSEIACDNYIVGLGAQDLSRLIVHVDMDAFYAAVEMRDEPELRKVPMAVGSNSMLSTSNYEARKYGVRAGMPGFIGKKLCPNLTIVPLNFDKYRKVAEIVRAVFAEYDPNFEAMSLDEAYLDLADFVSESKREDVEQVVHEMRAKVEKVTHGLTCSAGIAPNCRLAKICSDMNKPNGQFRLEASKEAIVDFMAKLPIRKVGGIGAVTEQLLSCLEVNTCGDLYEKRGLLRLLFSKISSEWFIRVSQGIGDSCVNEPRERKSIGTETTIKDTSNIDELRNILSQLSREVANDLMKRDLKARKVTLKLKTIDFEIKTITSTLNQSTWEAAIIAETAIKMLERHRAEEMQEGRTLTLRLVGVRVTHFNDSKGFQKTLFECFNKKSVDMEQDSKVTFKCPVCDSDVRAGSEQEFQRVHLELCLAKGFNDDNSNLSASEFDLDSNSSKTTATTMTTTTTTITTTTTTATTTTVAIATSSIPSEYVSCPVCSKRILLTEINSHIDTCLNEIALSTSIINDDKRNVDSKRNRVTTTLSNRGKRRKVNDTMAGMRSIDSFFSRKTST